MASAADNNEFDPFAVGFLGSTNNPVGKITENNKPSTAQTEQQSSTQEAAVYDDPLPTLGPETFTEVSIPNTKAGLCIKCGNVFPSTDAAFCPRSNLSQHILIYSLSVQSYLILCSCVCILYVDVAIHAISMMNYPCLILYPLQ